MIKSCAAILLFFFCLLCGNTQDVLLKLNGKEVHCVINKIDSFNIFYTPLGPLMSMEKSYVLQITPHKLFLMDGTEKNVVFDISTYDINGPYIYYRERQKKEIKKNLYRYFSYTRNNFDTLRPFQDSIIITKQEQILYFEDSLDDNFERSVDEQMAYTFGRRSARRNFTSPWSTLAGIATGFAGGLILPIFYAAGPAVIYCTVEAAFRPKVGATAPEDQKYLNNQYFIDGYREEGRILEIQNSLLGAIPSLALGILIKVFF